ncbi:MAG: hypothetical protein JW778_01105 [Candidatus Altiarchaeota archaeon]|nr:hypothetical protein [Candidatus Altiarchaeota archaeon]
MKKRLPRIRKELCSFLSEEDGRIPKKSMLAIGSTMGGIALAGLFSDVIPSAEATCPSETVFTCWHNNTINAAYDSTMCAITATHNLHANFSVGPGEHGTSGCRHDNSCPPPNDGLDPCL